VNMQTVTYRPASRKPHPKPFPHLSPAEIDELTARVGMRDLLRELNFIVNERSHRCACVIHGGKNPAAFSWTEDGRCCCHSCGFGGDKIALVQAVRGIGFREALQFLAVLAGVELSTERLPREKFEKQKRERERVEGASTKLAVIEANLRKRYAEEIFDLEEIRRDAGKRLKGLGEGERPRWGDEESFLWDALAFSAKWLPHALAAYSIVSFANTPDRAQFSLQPEERDRMIKETMMAGYVTDDAGRTMEVVI